jgi:hypothetical protein
MSTAKKQDPPHPTPDEPMTVREYFAHQEREHGMSVNAFAEKVGFMSGSTLNAHIRLGRPIKASTAKEFERWSGGKISAARMLEKGELV